MRRMYRLPKVSHSTAYGSAAYVSYGYESQSLSAIELDKPSLVTSSARGITLLNNGLLQHGHSRQSLSLPLLEAGMNRAKSQIL